MRIASTSGIDRSSVHTSHEQINLHCLAFTSSHYLSHSSLFASCFFTACTVRDEHGAAVSWERSGVVVVAALVIGGEEDAPGAPVCSLRVQVCLAIMMRPPCPLARPRHGGELPSLLVQLLQEVLVPALRIAEPLVPATCHPTILKEQLISR
jgi:hypothetical protein